jgi:uncharacterized protein (TIGR02284 family)
MNQNDTLSVIEKLIETSKDGEKGYKDAAGHATRSDLKAFFLEQSAERARFGSELQSALLKLGKSEKKESGSVAGALHRAWIDTKLSLGGADKSILESVESGEDKAKEEYEKALAAALPPDIAEVVQLQAQSVRNAHDKVKNLRDALAA